MKTRPERCPIDPDSEVYGAEVRVLLHGKRRGVYRVLFVIRADTVSYGAQFECIRDVADMNTMVHMIARVNSGRRTRTRWPARPDR